MDDCINRVSAEYSILAIVVSSLVLDKMVVEQAQYRERQQGNVYSIQLAWNTIETL